MERDRRKKLSAFLTRRGCIRPVCPPFEVARNFHDGYKRCASVVVSRLFPRKPRLFEHKIARHGFVDTFRRIGVNCQTFKSNTLGHP